jgi:transcription elongation factor S-II
LRQQPGTQRAPPGPLSAAPAAAGRAPRRRQVRTVVFNLKDASNPDLRGRVAAGVVAPDALAGMGAEEMASDARKVQNAQIRKEMAAEAVRGQQQQASTDQFQ